MSRLDDELKQALRRVDPPAEFAGRVLAQVESRRKIRRWWTGAIAAGLMLAGGLEWERERRIRVQGEQAKEQVMLALRITGSKLQFIKEKIHANDSTAH
jgi:hypothetical protein